jgi:acyl carrier protein
LVAAESVRAGSADHNTRATLTLRDQTIQDRVLKVIATSKRIPIESVQPDSSFESLGMDSLDRLNILFDLESEFDIEINDEEAKQVKSIQEMIEGVTQLVEAKNGTSPAK